MTNEKVPQASVIPTLRFLYTSRVDVESPLHLGHSPYGERRIIHIKGGSFYGPRLKGQVLCGGADWQFVRRDGIVELDARYTLETHDGALIYVRNWGLRHGPKEVMERLASGAHVDPRQYYFRTTPVLETGAPAYQWLNGMITVAAGERRAKEVIITVYEVT